jgi:hypothetical protein
MTLANMRRLGVRSLAVTCELCHHAAVLSAEPWPDHVPVPTFGPRMVCTEAAKALSVRESTLLFCIGSGLDRTKAGINDTVVTGVVVRGLADRDAGGALTLTDRGRAVLRAMLGEL